MLAKFAVVSCLALVAVATPVPAETNQCNTGPIQCCNSLQSASHFGIAMLLGLLGIPIQSVIGPVGVNCSPLGGTGGNCVNQPVCCQNNNFSGLIVIGCSPINIIF